MSSLHLLFFAYFLIYIIPDLWHNLFFILGSPFNLTNDCLCYLLCTTLSRWTQCSRDCILPSHELNTMLQI